LGPRAASVWLQCGDRQVDLDGQASVRWYSGAL
jgi:hypothetical protein